MKKMIIIERSRFARLLRNYRKSLYLNTLLTHICKQRRTLLTLTAEEMEGMLSVFGIANNLERIGDQATNIAEAVIFVTEGKDIKHTDKNLL